MDGQFHSCVRCGQLENGQYVLQFEDAERVIVRQLSVQHGLR